MKVPREGPETCERHVTKQALRYVQIYEGTQRHVTKQALRYVQIYEGTCD